MAPATEECGPSSVSAVHGDVDLADDASPGPPASGSFCCQCCRCWQRRKRAWPPRGTDKAGTSDNETLLSGGKTRFYCCESKMTTRPPRVSNRTRNPRNTSSENPQAATPVSAAFCPLFVRGRKDSQFDEIGVSPVEFAYDAFDERAYLDEFEIIHREEYDVSRTIVNPRRHRRSFIRHICRRKKRTRRVSDDTILAVSCTSDTSSSTITPHSEILLHPSQVGRVIIIKGKTYENAQRFAVNLVCRESNDIALHFNPRLDRGYIARNTKLNSQWGVEENSLNGPSPFEPNKEFTLQILVAEDEYRFCHNGRHICSYKHRVPIARLNILDIHGDLTLSVVKHEMVAEFPPVVPPVSVSDLLADNHLLSVGHTPLLIPTSHSWREDIPKQSYFFLGRFEPNIAIGNEIIIGGNVRLLPHAFFINLQNGLQMWKPPEVHFHINPRFGDHNHTVVNARLKGAWGYEERHTRCRFQPGRPFKLTIRVEEDRYRALVNGRALASMDHRARPSEINSIHISGDVDITSVGFNTDLTKSAGPTQKKGVKIADDSDWEHLGGMDDDDPYPTHATSERKLSLDDPVVDDDVAAGAYEEVITSVEVEEGNKILDLWNTGPKSERRNPGSPDSQQGECKDDIVCMTVSSPSRHVVVPEDFEPVPLSSATESAGKSNSIHSLPTEKKTSVSSTSLRIPNKGTLCLPEKSPTHSEKNLAITSVQIERLGSQESVSAVPVSKQDGNTGSDPINVNSEALIQSERRASLAALPIQVGVVEGNLGLTDSAETAVSTEVEVTARKTSSASDDSIFLSAEHTLTEDNDSKTNSKEVTLKSGYVPPSTSETKTDKESKGEKNPRKS